MASNRLPAHLAALRLGIREVRLLYVAWLGEQDRDPVIPSDFEEFLDWWWDQLEPEGGIPWQMDPRRLREWWIVWCHRTGRRYDIVPFDLTLFMEWWAAGIH